jgi:hypothetical protein
MLAGWGVEKTGKGCINLLNRKMNGTWFISNGKIVWSLWSLRLLEVLLVSTSDKYSIFELLSWTQSTGNFPIIQEVG